MKITKEYIIHLRVWPNRRKTGKRGGYFDVHIFPTKQEWADAQKKFRAKTRSLKQGGAVVFLPAQQIGKCWGHAYFYHSQFFDGNVAHECVHIAVETCRKMKIDPFNSVDEEEMFAGFVEVSLLQIFNALRYREGRNNEAL